jgi:hypothetical protein
MKWNPQPICHASGIGSVFGATTALSMSRSIHDGQQIPRGQRAGRFRFTGSHKQTDNFISLFMQQDGRSGAVNSTTHCQHDSFCHRSTTLTQRHGVNFFSKPSATSL